VIIYSKVFHWICFNFYFPNISFIGIFVVQFWCKFYMPVKPTATLFLDQRTTKRNGKSPVKLTIYCNGVKKRYKTGLSYTSTEWEKINKGKLKDDELKKQRIKLNLIIARANEVLESMPHFSFQKFEKAFFKSAELDTGLTEEVYPLFDIIIKELTDQGRVGNAMAYKTARNAYMSFKKNLVFSDITPAFLLSFEKYFLQNGKGLTSVGIYARHLRAVYYRAIKEKIVGTEDNPFKEYKIPSSRNIKKALSIEEIKTILNYQTENEQELKALDFWILSYLCNGININDLCRLKYSNIRDGFINFHRNKTINTRRSDLKPIRVPMSGKVEEIINRWRNPKVKENDGYVFDILSPSMKPEEQRKVIQNFNRSLSQAAEKIAEKLGIHGKLTNMTARHSFATVMKRKGISIELISESLGHSNLSTTEHYLDSFTDETKIKMAELLTDL
jgi:integrase/recombinase XerD